MWSVHKVIGFLLPCGILEWESSVGVHVEGEGIIVVLQLFIIMQPIAKGSLGTVTSFGALMLCVYLCIYFPDTYLLSFKENDKMCD